MAQGSQVGDIPDELAERLAFRPWTDVTMHDWAMIGVAPCLARPYLHPEAFRYYLPSLLIGALGDSDYLEWTLECLLPPGQRRTGRPEWVNVRESYSDEQRAAIGSYLKGVRLLFGKSAGPAAQHFFEELEAV